MGHFNSLSILFFFLLWPEGNGQALFDPKSADPPGRPVEALLGEAKVSHSWLYYKKHV